MEMHKRVVFFFFFGSVLFVMDARQAVWMAEALAMQLLCSSVQVDNEPIVENVKTQEELI